MPQPAHTGEQPLAFGSFRLFRERKVLLDDLRPVRIGSRALELLIALVERAGEIVGKNELMAYVWPDTVVEENNLRVHIAALRKLLGDGQGEARFILNVAGRGYSFVAPVARLSESQAVRPPAQSSATLPIALTRVVGREDVIRSVLALLPKRRLISIIGPAGIGKTTVALAVADRVTADGQRRVCFADLAAIGDPQLVVGVIAAATGVAAAAEDPLGMLVGSLRDAHLLLLLDNCEHVIEPVADVVERLLRAAPGITIIATSRERLTSDGEYVLSLGPLECPRPSQKVTAEQALRFPAVQLFVERAVNALDSFRIDDVNAATIAAICQRLDGIPLAMELVAARAGTLGLEVLIESLDQSLLLLSKGRRTASGRHQSLSATLQWSHRLLSSSEQAVLMRVATFSGAFTTDAALAVAVADDLTADDVRGALMVLAQRSLLIAEIGGTEVRYRLLYVTRRFAETRLEDQGEAAAARRRHAVHHQRALELAAGDWEKLDRAGWLQRHGAELEDLRAALHWCFGPHGDIGIGAALFVASLPFGMQLSLRDFERRANLTLGVLRDGSGDSSSAEMQVHIALATLMIQLGGREDSLRHHVERMYALADRIGLAKLMTEPMAARAVMALEHVDYPDAMRQVEVLQEISRQADDALAVLVADRVSAQVYHWAGDQTRARARAERVLRHPARSIPLAYGTSAVDRRASMRVVLARISWLEGRGEEAQQIGNEALEIAQADAPASICQVLAFACCPIALWRGDRTAARVAIDALLECAQRYDFLRWRRMALCFQQALELQASRGEAGSATPSTGDGPSLSPLCQDLLATLDARWFHVEMIARATGGRAGWCTAELLRLSGDRILQSPSGIESDVAIRSAEQRYLEALQCARDQQALAWELRAATSLARLRLLTGQPDESLGRLESLCNRFPARDPSADLRDARLLFAGREPLQGVH